MWLRARVRRQVSVYRVEINEPACIADARTGCYYAFTSITDPMRQPISAGADTRASGAPICLSGGFSRPGNREIPASPDLDPPPSSLLAEVRQPSPDSTSFLALRRRALGDSN
ncbi:hypothetical protein GW17_00058563 [Ensete ventricosum]|nr:hypothetical protein GW17_00058563 [Ensete ventricosum]